MSTTKLRKYDLNWPSNDLLKIELAMIQKGGQWSGKEGKLYGNGLFYHYKEAQKLLWPDDYHHRWSDLQLQEILQNTITCIASSKDTGKTHVALVRFGLTDYFAFPNNTLIIVSSTTLAALEGRVWGDMKSMFQKAKRLHPWLPGVCIDSKHCISTDDLDDKAVLARDLRKGLLCVPCKNSTGQFNDGIASYVGMKQERRRHLGDEFQFMAPAMMDSIANMNSGDYKGIFVGNPIGQGDPLDQMSEPECGWDAFPEPTKTTTWKNKRFLNSRSICLYGPDCPTFDTPDGPRKYPGLINADGIARVVAGYGINSHQYYSQCLGVRKTGLTAKRVITRELCNQFKAFDAPIWKGTARTKIAAGDIAYGGVGGDRCIGGHIEFGESADGGYILAMYPPVQVPVSVKNAKLPEDQIAEWFRDYCNTYQIPADHFFYDSTGRGTMGPAFARIWSPHIQPVEFGGSATARPVSLDVMIIDEDTGDKRLKRCDEHYSKFVTELWYSVRLIIESGQFRGMSEPVFIEGAAREWYEVKGNRIEIETKDDMKTRVGYSPDYFDWLVTACEGARRKGFQISRLASTTAAESSEEWLIDLEREQDDILKRSLINRAA